MQRPGNKWTMSPPKGSLAEQQRSLEIDRQLMAARRENLKHPQVLLVGCGGAGRRDVFGLFKKWKGKGEDRLHGSEEDESKKAAQESMYTRRKSVSHKQQLDDLPNECTVFPDSSDAEFSMHLTTIPISSKTAPVKLNMFDGVHALMYVVSMQSPKSFSNSLKLFAKLFGKSLVFRTKPLLLIFTYADVLKKSWSEGLSEDVIDKWAGVLRLNDAARDQILHLAKNAMVTEMVGQLLSCATFVFQRIFGGDSAKVYYLGLSDAVSLCKEQLGTRTDKIKIRTNAEAEEGVVFWTADVLKVWGSSALEAYDLQSEFVGEETQGHVVKISNSMLFAVLALILGVAWALIRGLF